MTVSFINIMMMVGFIIIIIILLLSDYECDKEYKQNFVHRVYNNFIENKNYVKISFSDFEKLYNKCPQKWTYKIIYSERECPIIVLAYQNAPREEYKIILLETFEDNRMCWDFFKNIEEDKKEKKKKEELENFQKEKIKLTIQWADDLNEED